MRNRSLRWRLLINFSVGALVLSALFVSLTYFGIERLLVRNQQATDLRQAYSNAVVIRNTVYTTPNQLYLTLNSVSTATGTEVFTRTLGTWTSTSAGSATSDIAPSVLRLVDHGAVVSVTTTNRGQVDYEVGIAIPATQTEFFEVFNLTPLQDTLQRLLTVLLLAAALTTLLGVFTGLWVSFRAVRPLNRTSEIASNIAEGDLESRLPTGGADREVARLANSFNTMVSKLVERIDREARFVSDVSHELRSPLTTLATASSVLQRFRSDMSEEAQQSLDLLVADLEIFRSLVDDLLEMARSDSGTDDTSFVPTPVGQLLEQCVRASSQRLGITPPTIEVEPRVAALQFNVDRRRFERVTANLIENAYKYGCTSCVIRIREEGGELVIDVDDNGPGIAPEEREHIFDRFYRGRSAHDRGSVAGTGIGLALVKSHVTAFHGSLAVSESPEGGARFELRFPTLTHEDLA